MTIPLDACNLGKQIDFDELLNNDLDEIPGVLNGYGKPQSVAYYMINGDSKSLLSKIAKWSIVGNGQFPMDFLVPVISGISIPNATGIFVTSEDHSEVSNLEVNPYYGRDLASKSESYGIVSDILDEGNYSSSTASAMQKAQSILDDTTFKKEFPSYDRRIISMEPFDSFVMKVEIATAKGLFVINTGGKDVGLIITMPDGTTFNPLLSTYEGITVVRSQGSIGIDIERLQSRGTWQFALLNNELTEQQYPVSIWYGNPVYGKVSLPDAKPIVGETVTINVGLGIQNQQLAAASTITETVTGVSSTVTAPNGTQQSFETAVISFIVDQMGTYVIDTEINTINQSGNEVRRLESAVLEVQLDSERRIYLPLIQR